MDWKQKLTSRKLWMAVAGLTMGLIAFFGADENTAQTVGGLIMALASVVGYIFGEGLVDAARAEGVSKNDD